MDHWYSTQCFEIVSDETSHQVPFTYNYMQLNRRRHYGLSCITWLIHVWVTPHEDNYQGCPEQVCTPLCVISSLISWCYFQRWLIPITFRNSNYPWVTDKVRAERLETKLEVCSQIIGRKQEVDSAKVVFSSRDERYQCHFVAFLPNSGSYGDAEVRGRRALV